MSALLTFMERHGVSRRMGAIVLAGLMVYVFATHVYRIQRDDNYSFREAQTAMISENLLEDDFDVIHPRVSFFGPDHRYLALEFPLYNAVVAAGYKLVGKDPALGRWVSVLCFAASCFYVFALARRGAGEAVAWWALLVYLLMPAMQVYAQSHRPDMMMYLLLYAALYHTDDALKKGGIGNWLVSVLCWSGAVVMKMTPAVIFACCYVSWVAGLRLWAPGGRHRGLQLSAVAVLLVALLALWVRHAAALNAGTPYGEESFREFNYGTLRDRFDLEYYGLILKEALKLLSPGWMLLAVIGLWGGWKARLAVSPFGEFLAAALLSYLVFWRTSIVNPHYMMIFALPVAFYAGHGVTLLSGLWHEARMGSRRWVKPAIAGFASLTLATNVVFNGLVADHFTKRLPHRNALAAADFFRESIPTAGYVAYVSGQLKHTETDPVFFYYSKRTGRNLPDIDTVIFRRGEFVSKGYRWVAVSYGPEKSYRYQTPASITRELDAAGIGVWHIGQGFVVAKLD